MALHKMHLGLDARSSMAFLWGNIYCGALRKSSYRHHRRIQSFARFKMTRLERIGHNILKYALVIPCIGAVCLGMLTDGAIRFAEMQKAEKALSVNLVNMPLKDLLEISI